MFTMHRFSVYAWCFSAIVQFAHAVPDVRPTLTAVYGEGGLAVQGYSPRPTGLSSDPLQIFKRSVPDDVCGYVSANIYTPFTCYNDQFCGVRTDLGVVGCCTSYSQLPDGEYTLSGCIFRTKCYGSTETSLCTGTCLSDPRIAYCTDSDYPYCMVYTYTDVGLSYFRCNAKPGVVTNVAETYTTQSSAPAPATAVTTSASVTAASITTIITTTYSSAGSSVQSVVTSKSVVVVTSSANSVSLLASVSNPGTQAQNQAGSNTTPTGGDGGSNVSTVPSISANSSSTSTPLGPIVGGAVGGFAVIVGAIALLAYFCLRHKKNKKLAAGAGAGVAGGAAAAGAAAYVANNNNANQEYKPSAAAGMKAREPVVASVYDHDKMAAPPPSYQSPQMQPAQMASPQLSHGYMSPARSEMEGRAVSPMPHSTSGRSELASPPMSFQSGPTMDWNRPYHEME